MNVDDIKQISVIGSGLMGHGIALQFALGGYEVSINDVSEQNLDRATKNIRDTLEMLVHMDLVNKSALNQVPNKISKSTSLSKTVESADFVIEAVFEDLALKQNVFAELDELAPKHTILSSNTSSFMSSQLASSTNRREKVVVANWWNPPYLLPLVEIVKGPDTSNHTIDTTVNLFTKLGKKPVVLQKESLGFIGNRMQFALLREAISIVENGIATTGDVDMVVKNSFGRRLSVAGPFEAFDLAGWDTITAIIEQLFPDLDTKNTVPTLIQEMLKEGNLGVKSGQGFYHWNQESVANVKQRVGKALSTIEKMSRLK